MEPKNFSEKVESDDTYPALRLERLLGLHNIGTRWIMPGGQTMKKMEQELWLNGILNAVPSHKLIPFQTFQKAEAYLKILESLNPSLSTLQYNPKKWGDLQGILHGVVSGFNINDIQAYLDGKHQPLNSVTSRIMRQFLSKHVNINFSKSDCPPQLKEEFERNAVSIIQNALENLLDLRWRRASQQTIKEIHKQLDEKYGPESPANQPIETAKP